MKDRRGPTVDGSGVCAHGRRKVEGCLTLAECLTLTHGEWGDRGVSGRVEGVRNLFTNDSPSTPTPSSPGHGGGLWRAGPPYPVSVQVRGPGVSRPRPSYPSLSRRRSTLGSSSVLLVFSEWTSQFFPNPDILSYFNF